MCAKQGDGQAVLSSREPELQSGWLIDALAVNPVMSGAAVGLAWGITLRTWMRFISSLPEFSLAGTLGILGAATIVGSVLGWAHHRRRMGGTGWWRLSLGSLGLLGAGGAVMWPTVIFWGLAIGRRRPWWLVATLGVAGALAQVPVMNEALFENSRLGPLGVATALVWYAPMLVFAAWAFSVVFSPGLAESTSSGVKRTLIAAGVVGMSVVGVVAGGLAG